jgi:hypothetical protein
MNFVDDVCLPMFMMNMPLVFKVQAAVADCLPPLVPVIKDEAGVYVQQLLKVLLQSGDYAEKKG